MKRQRLFGLDREERLKKSELRRICTAGRRFSHRRVKLFVLTGETAGKQAAFVVRGSKKSAVRRNRYKRLLRETYRLNKHRIKDGVRLVLIINAPSQDVLKEDIEEDFLAACKQADIII